MRNEITLTTDEAAAAYNFIMRHLVEADIDEDERAKIEAAASALDQADRIVIGPEGSQN